MTDRELIELAARAAGYDVQWNPHWMCFAHTNPVPDKFGRQRFPWAPLDDDGDAQRLAVTLGLEIIPADDQGNAYCGRREVDERFTAVPTINSDPYAATRRAIVLAAAEMAKDMT